MGILRYVGCIDCELYRNLDKFHNGPTPKNRDEAILYCDEIREDVFGYALLTSFLLDHLGHRCIRFTEDDWEYSPSAHYCYGHEDDKATVNGIHFVRERINFWRDSK